MVKVILSRLDRRRSAQVRRRLMNPRVRWLVCSGCIGGYVWVAVVVGTVRRTDCGLLGCYGGVVGLGVVVIVAVYC